MYIISDNDFEHAVEYIRLMIDSETGSDLRAYNKRRMAAIMLRRWRSKRSITLSELPESVRKLLRQK